MVIVAAIMIAAMPAQASKINVPEDACAMIQGAAMTENGECLIQGQKDAHKTLIKEKAGHIPETKNNKLVNTYLPAVKNAQPKVFNNSLGTVVRILAAYISEAANKLNSLLGKLQASLGKVKTGLNAREVALNAKSYMGAGKDLESKKRSLEQNFSTRNKSNSPLGCVKPKTDRLPEQIAANKGLRSAFNAIMNESDPILSALSMLVPRNNKDGNQESGIMEGLDRPWLKGETAPMAALIGILTGAVEKNFKGSLGRFDKNRMRLSIARQNTAEIAASILVSKLLTDGYTDNETLIKTMLEGTKGAQTYKNKIGTKRTANSLQARQLLVQVEKSRNNEWLMKAKLISEAMKWQ